MRQRNSWTRTAIGVLALTLAASVATPPAWATEPAPRAALATPIADAAAAKVAAANPSQDLRATQAPATTATESRPFFKSTKGVVAIVLMAGVMAYTIHSRTCCAIHSPGR